MPDAAFEDTFQQFAALIGSSTSRLPADIGCYYIPAVPRSAAVLETASVPYEDVECLYDSPPDALVVTGTEPRCAELSDEPYWDALAGLLRWAESVVPSVLLSCLASHAAVLALDGIRRSRLPSKQSGVFNHVVDRVASARARSGIQSGVSPFPAQRDSRLGLRATPIPVGCLIRPHRLDRGRPRETRQITRPATRSPRI